MCRWPFPIWSSFASRLIRYNSRPSSSWERPPCISSAGHGYAEPSWGQRPSHWSPIFHPLGARRWQNSLRHGMRRSDPAVPWRTGTAFFVPSLQSIVISLLICSPSWRSGTTIGWLVVGYTKDKARSCVLAWTKSPQTGWRLWAIRISPLHLLGKDKARSYLANRRWRASPPRSCFGMPVLNYSFAQFSLLIW